MTAHYDISRYVLQIYPALIFLAAAGAAFLVGRLPAGRIRTGGTLLLIAAWCGMPWFFKANIQGKTRMQYANSDIIELEKNLPAGKPIFVLQGLSIIFHALKYDCGREVYAAGSLADERLAGLIEDEGALYLLRSPGIGWTQLPETIRRYRVREILKKEAGDPYGSFPFYAYEILPEKLTATPAGTASVFTGAMGPRDRFLPVHITYAAGPGGIAPGGGLRIFFPESGFPAPQNERPGEAGYLSAVTGPDDLENAPSLEVAIADRHVEITFGASFTPGDRLLITFLIPPPPAAERGPNKDFSAICFPLSVDSQGQGAYQSFPHPICF